MEAIDVNIFLVPIPADLEILVGCSTPPELVVSTTLTYLVQSAEAMNEYFEA